jgi:hypothetical protein
MGLLDDAIREHLDLKRRRGADPAEIARAEQEALGPVRREPEPHADAVAEPAVEPHADGEPDQEPPAEAQEHEAEHEPEAEHAPTAGEPGPERTPAPAPAPARDPHPDDLVLQPTTEFRLEGHHEEDEPAGRDDVLEETPDFLQETPEHDRLWFEQRPPRDFDFDG